MSHDRDRDGRESISSQDIVERISQAAPVPVFGLYDALLGHGIVGGCLAPVEEQGKRAGEIAVRVLRGESPANIPFTGTEMNRFVFDWRQLRRWGIREQDLPEGSQVAFREPTLWEEYWAYLSTGVAAIVLQSLLITALLVNRKRRLRAEHALADRLRFETVLSDLSSRFVHIVPETVHREIQCALAQVAEELALDRGTVFEVSGDGLQLRATQSWVRAGQAAGAAGHPRGVDPLVVDETEAGRHCSFLVRVPVAGRGDIREGTDGAARIEGWCRGPPEGEGNDSRDACLRATDPRAVLERHNPSANEARRRGDRQCPGPCPGRRNPLRKPEGSSATRRQTAHGTRGRTQAIGPRDARRRLATTGRDRDRGWQVGAAVPDGGSLAGSDGRPQGAI